MDDFAFRKRYSYGTVMVDFDNHRIIDIIDSRDTKDVENWLKSCLNLQVIACDGAPTYASASTNAHPNVMIPGSKHSVLYMLALVLILKI